jgi:hypothetical protein
MAQLKHCNSCGQTKEISQFSKRSKSADGLQGKCKECNKKDNLEFRTQKPEHHAIWQKTNKEKFHQYVSKWYNSKVIKDDSRSKIYTITAPNGKVYVGMCQTAFSRRVAAHRKTFKENKRTLPLLHKSFEQFGWDNHIWNTIDLSGVDREMLKIIESNMIKINKVEGISLNIKP